MVVCRRANVGEVTENVAERENEHISSRSSAERIEKIPASSKVQGEDTSYRRRWSVHSPAQYSTLRLWGELGLQRTIVSFRFAPATHISLQELDCQIGLFFLFPTVWFVRLCAEIVESNPISSYQATCARNNHEDHPGCTLCRAIGRPVSASKCF